jgi:hypothetical protein
MNGTIISEEKLLELKDLAKRAEEINKELVNLEIKITFGDRSDMTSLRLRMEASKLSDETKQLTELIKNLKL